MTSRAIRRTNLPVSLYGHRHYLRRPCPLVNAQRPMIARIVTRSNARTNERRSYVASLIFRPRRHDSAADRLGLEDEKPAAVRRIPRRCYVSDLMFGDSMSRAACCFGKRFIGGGLTLIEFRTDFLPSAAPCSTKEFADPEIGGYIDG